MWDDGFVVVRATDRPPVVHTQYFIYPLLILYIVYFLNGGTQMVVQWFTKKFRNLFFSSNLILEMLIALLKLF